jgi:hypothetical protein
VFKFRPQEGIPGVCVFRGFPKFLVDVDIVDLSEIGSPSFFFKFSSLTSRRFSEVVQFLLPTTKLSRQRTFK